MVNSFISPGNNQFHLTGIDEEQAIARSTNIPVSRSRQKIPETFVNACSLDDCVNVNQENDDGFVSLNEESTAECKSNELKTNTDIDKRTLEQKFSSNSNAKRCEKMVNTEARPVVVVVDSTAAKGKIIVPFVSEKNVDVELAEDETDDSSQQQHYCENRLFNSTFDMNTELTFTSKDIPPAPFSSSRNFFANTIAITRMGDDCDANLLNNGSGSCSTLTESSLRKESLKSPKITQLVSSGFIHN